MTADSPSCSAVPALKASARSSLHALAAGVMLGLATLAQAADIERSHSQTGTSELLLLEIKVLGRGLEGIFEVEQRADGQLLLPEAVWTQARMLPAGAAYLQTNGQRSYALDAVSGVEYHIDRSRLVLEISAPAAAFDTAQVSLYDGRPAPPSSSPLGVYLDYDLSLTRAQDYNRSGALFEAVAFGDDSAAVVGGAWRGDPHDRALVRSDAYWRKDFPATMQTLIVGDSVSSGGMWSQPARFGGIRFARDFNLAPGYVSYPMPTLSGAAALPSTVDVLINNQLSTSTEVPAGPFALTNVPIVNGAGEMQLVVRDLLGRETIIRQDYYVASQLLRPGLSDYSFEAGALRENFGVRNADYGPWFGTGTFRRGFSDRVTGELHAELQAERQAAGAGVTAVLGQFGVLGVAAGYANADHEHGGRYRIGFQHSGRAGGVSLSIEHNDRGFVPFAQAPLSARVRDQWGGSAGLLIGAGINLGLSYTRRSTWGDDHFTLASANVGLPLPGSAFLTFNVGKQLEHGGWFGGAQLVVPLDGRTSATASSARRSDGEWSHTVQATRSTPSGPGWGWSVGASDDGGRRRAQAGAEYNGNQGQISADASQRGGDTDLRLRAAGAIGWMHGLAFATRRIDQGAFAVVHVGDVADVPVSLSNQVVANTNEHGLALVPRLLPYQSNRLTIHPDQLPMDVEIRGVEEDVIPYARSGVLVDFPVRHTRAALLVLHDAHGDPLPAGAKVTVLPGNLSFVVFMRGEVYLTDLEDGSRIDVRWDGGGCVLSLPQIPVDSESGAPHIGPLTCAGTP